MNAALVTLAIIALAVFACRHWRCLFEIIVAIAVLDIAGGFLLYHAMPLIGFLVFLYFVSHPPT